MMTTRCSKTTLPVILSAAKNLFRRVRFFAALRMTATESMPEACEHPTFYIHFLIALNLYRHLQDCLCCVFSAVHGPVYTARFRVLSRQKYALHRPMIIW